MGAFSVDHIDDERRFAKEASPTPTARNSNGRRIDPAAARLRTHSEAQRTLGIAKMSPRLTKHVAGLRRRFRSGRSRRGEIESYLLALDFLRTFT
jgi:hypothetical protein